MWCVHEDTLFRTSLKEIGTYMAGRRKNQIDLRGDVVKGKELEGPRPEPKTEALDLTQAREMFTRELRIFSKATQAHHRDCVKALERILGMQGIEIRDVRQLTTRLLKDHFVYYMLDDMQLKPTTVNDRIRGVRSFTKFLAAEGYLPTNIGLELRQVREERTIIDAFNEDQIAALLRRPNRKTFTGLRDFTIMLLLLETGIRVSELTAIRLDDVRMKEGKILIHGKGAKQRFVPFQSKFRRALREYLTARGAVETDALFCSLNGKPMNKRSVQVAIQHYGEEAHISGVRCSPHTFRHTMAKYYILAGGDIFSLQRILGHSSLDMVRLYVDLFGSDVEEQHRKFSFLENRLD